MNNIAIFITSAVKTDFERFKRTMGIYCCMTEKKGNYKEKEENIPQRGRVLSFGFENVWRLLSYSSCRSCRYCKIHLPWQDTLWGKWRHWRISGEAPPFSWKYGVSYWSKKVSSYTRLPFPPLLWARKSRSSLRSETVEELCIDH